MLATFLAMAEEPNSPSFDEWMERSIAEDDRRRKARWAALSPDQQKRLREMLRKRRGRPKGSHNSPPCNGDLLRECRGAQSQERFAEECGVSVATIKRGEAGGRLTESVLIQIATAIRRLCGRNITAEDLQK